MLKIISISDVITNSSSEVFCTINSDSKTLDEIYEFLGSKFLQSDDSEGGIWYDDKYLSISIAHGSWLDGIEKVLKPGLKELLKPWQGKYTIDYDC